jgi:hypothetical protein
MATLDQIVKREREKIGNAKVSMAEENSALDILHQSRPTVRLVMTVHDQEGELY